MQRLPLAMVLLLLAPLAFAQIYTWTDSSGTVHFSEAPPEAGVHYREIKTSSTATASAAAQPTTNEPGDDGAPAPAAPAQPMADTPENRTKLCATLTANLSTLNANGPVTLQQDGKSAAMDDSQRQAQLATTQAQYQQYCQQP